MKVLIALALVATMAGPAFACGRAHEGGEDSPKAGVTEPAANVHETQGHAVEAATQTHEQTAGEAHEGDTHDAHGHEGTDHEGHHE